jgi:hypothetical protein
MYHYSRRSAHECAKANNKLGAVISSGLWSVNDNGQHEAGEAENSCKSPNPQQHRELVPIRCTLSCLNNMIILSI